MAEKQEQSQSEGEPRAENKILTKKKLVAAVQAKRSGKLAAEDVSVMNVQLRAAAMVRQPIILGDRDVSDGIWIMDFDPTDKIIVIDSDPTDRLPTPG